MGPAIRGHQRRLEPQDLPDLSAPPRRQPAEIDGEPHDQQHPNPEGRDRKTQDGQRHDQLGRDAVRTVARIHSGRHTNQRSDAYGNQHQFQRRGQTRKDKRRDRDVVDHGPAQIALEHIADEGEILLPQGLVEPVLPDQVLADLLACARVDHHVDRVADRVDANKDDDRHDEHDHHRLYQSTDKIAKHRNPPFFPCPISPDRRRRRRAS